MHPRYIDGAAAVVCVVRTQRPYVHGVVKMGVNEIHFQFYTSRSIWYHPPLSITPLDDLIHKLASTDERLRQSMTEQHMTYSDARCEQNDLQRVHWTSA